MEKPIPKLEDAANDQVVHCLCRLATERADAANDACALDATRMLLLSQPNLRDSREYNFTSNFH
jgi:hypothetical protein